MSLLLAEGYASPGNFTLGRLFNERVIVQERVNARLASEATLTFQAVAAAFSGKDMLKEFNKSLKRLHDAD